jgi:subtilisin family serine protease
MTPPASIRWPDAAALSDALHHGDGAGVRIAVLDSGIEIAHPAFAGTSLEDDLDFHSAPDGSVTLTEGAGHDAYGHGTAIAWLIRSVAPAAMIGSFRIMGDGRLSSKRELVREAAHEALRRGYRILNCSFGHRAAALYAMDYKEWVDAAYVASCSVVAACDNAGAGQQVFPAHFPSVIGVDRSEKPLDLLRRPGRLVEFAALGENVMVPWRDGAWKSVIGSSYAAPRVVGLVARLLSALPSLSAAQVKAALQALATPEDS